MLKSLTARIGAALSAAALVVSVYAAIPAGTAVAEEIKQCNLSYPQARTVTNVSAPYGVSARLADLITVKVLNTTKYDCDYVSVVIYPREGTGFHSIVSTTGGWTCEAPSVGSTDPTTCYNETLAPYSTNTLRVRYDRPVINGPVSGTASSELILDDCYRSLSVSDPAICLDQPN